MMCFEIAMFGCQRATSPGVPPAEAATSPSVQDPTPEAQGDLVRTQESQVSIGPKGWKVYTPPEGDFSIMVQDDLVKIRSTKHNSYKVRRYEFARVSVEVYSDKTGKWAENTVESIRQETEDILQAARLDVTLRGVTLPGMPGVEWRVADKWGERVCRRFCELDGPRSFFLTVGKEKDGLSEDEVLAIVDSFKLLRWSGETVLCGL